MYSININAFHSTDPKGYFNSNKMVSLAIGCRFISGQYKLNVYLISSSGNVKVLKAVQEEEEYLVAASLLGENEFL